MSSDFTDSPSIKKGLLQQAAIALQTQFRRVIFDADKRVHNIRFEVHETPTASTPHLEIVGQLEFEGELEEVLDALRPSYPFQIVSSGVKADQTTVIEANLSPWVLSAAWDKLDGMPAVFQLVILLVEPAASIPFPVDSTSTSDPKPYREVIFLIHGIRDRARWQSLVKRVLEEIDGVVVIPIRYGYFDAFRFWLPVWTREEPIRYTREQIQIGKNRYRVGNYSVIAHSFGTYTISKVLAQTKDLVLDRLVLCGCIIPNDYPWEHLSGRINNKVINDFGTRDIWPFWARKLSWGYGDTGRYGFGRSDIQDRAHDKAHGDYFHEHFVREFWKPLFESSRVEPSNWEEQAPKPTWLMETVSILPLKSMLLATVLAVMTYLYFQRL
jgi:pimeloyl-ACP methyl ester carboxylesterase